MSSADLAVRRSIPFQAALSESSGEARDSLPAPPVIQRRFSYAADSRTRDPEASGVPTPVDRALDGVKKLRFALNLVNGNGLCAFNQRLRVASRRTQGHIDRPAISSGVPGISSRTMVLLPVRRAPVITTAGMTRSGSGTRFVTKRGSSELMVHDCHSQLECQSCTS